MCQSPASLGSNLLGSRMNTPLYGPKTMDEALEILLRAINPTQKGTIRKQAKDDFITSAHFGLALWIRNAMIHENPYYIDLMADFQRGCREGKWEGEAEPDSVSGVIAGLLWEKTAGSHYNRIHEREPNAHDT